MNIAIQDSDNDQQRRLITQVQCRLGDLIPGKLYSLEAILGIEYWEEEDDPHRGMGMRFSALVAQGRLPFVFTGFTKQRHNQYRYTG